MEDKILNKNLYNKYEYAIEVIANKCQNEEELKEALIKFPPYIIVQKTCDYLKSNYDVDITLSDFCTLYNDGIIYDNIIDIMNTKPYVEETVNKQNF